MTVDRASEYSTVPAVVVVDVGAFLSLALSLLITPHTSTNPILYFVMVRVVRLPLGEYVYRKNEQRGIKKNYIEHRSVFASVRYIIILRPSVCMQPSTSVTRET